MLASGQPLNHPGRNRQELDRSLVHIELLEPEEAFVILAHTVQSAWNAVGCVVHVHVDVHVHGPDARSVTCDEC